MNAVHAATGILGQSLNVFREMGQRLLGLIDLAAYLVGIRPYKKLRLRVVILRDEAGRPLAGEADVMASVEEAVRVLAKEARVRVIPAHPLVVTLPEAAPKAALDVHCDDGAWQEDFGPCGGYFRQALARTTAGRWLGYGAPVTVFIVRHISNKGGCSLGPLTDYVTLEAQMLGRAQHRIMVHEVGHACGLWHSQEKPNLMFPKGPGDLLAWWQVALMRNSRHVTYF